MSGGTACPHKSHRPYWFVVQRRCNHSAFNGYHHTPSDYSTVYCNVHGCHGVWRTKAAYVMGLPDAPPEWPNVTPVRINSKEVSSE
jgi:hypothetical protein